jgi:hypothetical protein
MAEQNTNPGTVRVTINQTDTDLSFEQLGVNMDTADGQILDAVRGVVGEQIRDQEGQYTFAVRRALNTNMVYVYPKPGFGR